MRLLASVGPGLRRPPIDSSEYLARTTAVIGEAFSRWREVQGGRSIGTRKRINIGHCHGGGLTINASTSHKRCQRNQANS